MSNESGIEWQPIDWWRMPTYEYGDKKKVKRVDGSRLDYIIYSLSYETIDRVIVEKVAARPGQGVSSMFSFGHSVGVVHGILGARGRDWTEVTPQAWKKKAGLIGSDKDASRLRAQGDWPEWGELKFKGKGQAFADAAYIALGGIE